MIGLLDFFGLNTISRLPISPYKDIEGVKADILAKFPIFLPKKQEPAKKEGNAAVKRSNSSTRKDSELSFPKVKQGKRTSS